MSRVTLEAIHQYYGQHCVLKDINLQVENSEFIVIVGPSGCGKSTLLRLVAGLDDLKQGRIIINERCMNKVPAHRRDIAMVFQNYALYPHMSVFENMAYALRLRKWSSAKIKQRVHEVALLLELTDYLARKPQALSGGQKQRVAMGRAIVRAPALYLFDEPLSNLDASLKHQMRYEIKRLHQKLKITSLYVTHDQIEAMTMASRILVLNQGLVEQIGTPHEVYFAPATLFVAKFMGIHPLNILQGDIDLATTCFISEEGLALPLPNKIEKINKQRCILAIRPEHLKLTLKANTPYAFPVQTGLIDNMGAEKLVHVRSLKTNQAFTVKTPAEQLINEVMWMELSYQQANLYDAVHEHRLGGWL
ncbi:MAG: glycerol-3-phosphate ABC transporter ATP-binding protein [Legionellaceae bacterium]|nr:glycerol-3-phosphate ABC transporter ATP-binding protein [Legionellaceae bacterium]HCA89466.1 glycerol-3-phosphate ABC transporter ATP-binding protein [Legionellales bacterium]|tara:strand:+ start:10531 stop:11616 length:1086 start_codon:yes stop_codon:yes gene_type:complete